MLPTVLAPLLNDAGADEIIVVCDRDPDALQLVERMAKSDPRLRAVAADGAGESGGRQRGAEAATGDVLVLLDDDVVASPGLVSGHAAHHRTLDRLIVIGPMPVAATRAATLADRLYAEAYDRWLAECGRRPATLLERLWLGNASLPRAAALAVGLEEPRMRGLVHQDRELGLRLRSAGFDAVLDPDLRAEHRRSQPVADLAPYSRRAGAGLRRIHELHGTPLPRIGAVDRIASLAPARLGLRVASRRLEGRAALLAARALRRAEIARGLR